MWIVRYPGRAASLLLLMALVAPARAQVEEGTSGRVPWSGYWWPINEGRMVEPLSAYDKAYGTSAAAWEQRNHPISTAASWWGYCHAWSAASVLEVEPTQASSLTVGTRKGLLTAAHSDDPANIYGQRYEGPNDDLQDLYPDVLWKYLKLYVKQQHLPLIMDMEAAEEVWNYPVYSYRVTYQPTGGDDYRGYMTLYYAEDDVPSNYVGVKVAARNYTFNFKMRNGSLVMGSGRWTGTSVRDHPDFAWYPTAQRSENPQLDYQKVVKLVYGGAPPVNPPPPVPDPLHPPQPGGHVPETPLAPPLPGETTPPADTTLTPGELLTMIAHRDNKKSDFRFDITVDRFDGGKYQVGDRYWVIAKTQKAGYLYLFHVDKDGNFKMIFPVGNQDNVLPAKQEVKIGAPDGKDKVEFICPDVPGDQHVLGFITDRPLRFPGVHHQGAKKGKGQGQQVPIYVNPQTKKVMRGLIIESLDGKVTPQTVDEKTGVAIDPRPGQGGKKLDLKFATDDVKFYVAPAAKKGS